MRTPRSHSAAALAALIVLAPFAAGCGARDSARAGGAPGDGTPVSGGELVYGRGHDSVRLDPGHETDGESFKVMDNIYDNLVTYADTTTDIVPELAYRWVV